MEKVINPITLEKTADKSGEDLKNALFYESPNGKSVRRTLEDIRVDFKNTNVKKTEEVKFITQGWSETVGKIYIHFDIDIDY